MTASLVFLHAYTPLHSGTGQGVESIDLPIARERATGLPVVPGSSIKGCLRDTIPLTDEEKAAVFGPEEERGCTRRCIAGRGCAVDSTASSLFDGNIRLGRVSFRVEASETGRRCLRH